MHEAKNATAIKRRREDSAGTKENSDRPIQPPQFVCSVRPHVNDPGTWTPTPGTWTQGQPEQPLLILVCSQCGGRSGPVQAPVPKQTTPWPPGRGHRQTFYRHHVGSTHFTQVLENLRCGSHVGYSSSSRAARRVAEAPTPGDLVCTSYNRQKEQPRGPFDKALHAQADKAAFLSARTATRRTTNQNSNNVLYDR
ncbi:hypothetical protein MRX96_047113 [Rhipicephalus microplus]